MAAEKLTAWDFVEKYHPNYNCNDIGHIDDLFKIMNGENQEGDTASKILAEDFDGNDSDPAITHEYNRLLVRVYEAAMEAFLESQTPQDPNEQIYEMLGQYTGNEREDYDTVIFELRQALQTEPNSTVDYASDTIEMWEKVQNKFTVKEFCDLTGISAMPLISERN